MSIHDCLNIQWSDATRDVTLTAEDFLVFNVSGMKYETLRATLERFPRTLLGNQRRRDKYFVTSKKAYFFDRCKQSFEAILFYYQTGGILTRPPAIPMGRFEEEVVFYELGDEVLKSLWKEEGFLGDMVTMETPNHFLGKFLPSSD